MINLNIEIGDLINLNIVWGTYRMGDLINLNIV